VPDSTLTPWHVWLPSGRNQWPHPIPESLDVQWLQLWPLGWEGYRTLRRYWLLLLHGTTTDWINNTASMLQILNWFEVSNFLINVTSQPLRDQIRIILYGADSKINFKNSGSRHVKIAWLGVQKLIPCSKLIFEWAHDDRPSDSGVGSWERLSLDTCSANT
jgi:hypothetical protein